MLSGATNDPKLSTLTALSGAFSCTLDELLGTSSYSGGASLPDIMRKYSELDASGKETADYIINKEYSRLQKAKEASAKRDSEPQKDDIIKAARKYVLSASIPQPPPPAPAPTLPTATILIFPYTANSTTDMADFAIKVRGNSMMPKYSDGDILLVSDRKNIEIGELGIFAVDGESYFKQYGGNRLISLNPDYSDIPLDTAVSVTCFGKVIGKLKR